MLILLCLCLVESVTLLLLKVLQLLPNFIFSAPSACVLPPIHIHTYYDDYAVRILNQPPAYKQVIPGQELPIHTGKTVVQLGSAQLCSTLFVQ